VRGAAARAKVKQIGRRVNHQRARGAKKGKRGTNDTRVKRREGAYQRARRINVREKQGPFGRKQIKERRGGYAVRSEQPKTTF
jgi:hypothetical protein